VSAGESGSVSEFATRAAADATRRCELTYERAACELAVCELPRELTDLDLGRELQPITTEDARCNDVPNSKMTSCFIGAGLNFCDIGR
jgi:hypothetical protein